MQHIRIQKAGVCGLFFLLVISGIIPTILSRFTQDTTPVSALENSTCACPLNNQEQMRTKSEPFVYYDEKTQRTVTRFEYDPSWIYLHNDNEAEYHIDLGSTYGSMVTSV